MPRFFKKPGDTGLERLFETRSHAWEAVGLELEVDEHAVRSAAERLAIALPLLIAAIVGESIGQNHIAHDVRTPVRAAAVIVVLALGWLISRDLARTAPALFRRMDPATAGTVGFLIRLVAVMVTVLGALAVGGISLQALAVGGAFTAVVLGLAAQQTLGNLFAGMVLLSARPFRVGERVRLQAGVVGGTTEGIVSSLGLLYTTLARGDDRIMIPNNVVLAAIVVPIREPEAINVKVRLASGVRPGQLQEMLDTTIGTPTRNPPHVLLEEIDGDAAVVRIQATPEHHADGPRLADEVIALLASVTGEQRDNDSAPAADQITPGSPRRYVPTDP